MPRLRMRRRAERERVKAGDRPRAHGEDIAQDAADPGRRALIGLDVARMVVAFHLEHDGKPVADIDHAGVLARSLDDPRRFRRQHAQMDFRGLVRAMLVPHRRENPQLGDGRLAAHEGENALVFLRRQAMRRNEVGGDLRTLGSLRPPLGLRRRRFLGRARRGLFGRRLLRCRGSTHAACLKWSTRPANRPRPSVGPSAASTWFSGCGIRPSTLPLCVEHAGDGIGCAVDVPGRVERAIGIGVAEQHPALAFEPRDGRFIGDVIALAVGDRHTDHLARIVAAGKRRVGALDAQIDVAADESHRRIAHQHAGKEPRFAQDLEAVAHPEHETAVPGVGAHRVHDRRARGNCPAAQIIAVGEAARHHDEIGPAGQARCRHARPSPARGRRRGGACAPCRVRD